MKNRMLIYLFSTFIIIGCVNENTETINDDQFCNVENPLQELNWLSDLIDTNDNVTVKREIYICIYKEQEGFLIDLCVDCPDGLVQFYDCEGTVICEFGGIDGRNTCPDFEDNVSSKKLIYSDSSTAVNNDTLYCTNNPLDELEWLNKIVAENKDNPAKAEIYKCIYKNQEGFIVDLCVNCPDGLVQFCDCEGNVICEFGGIDGRNTCPDFEDSISNKVLIWNNK
jgi:hypothetical protein